MSGGCINNAKRLHLDRGNSLFLKHHNHAPDAMFMAEAVGLNALRKANALRIPGVIHVEDDFILLEDLGQGQAEDKYWQELGAGLAILHSQRMPQFGFAIDNYCGSTPQLNHTTADGWDFFANYRILALASSAFHRNLLNRDDLSDLEFIAARLSDWIPAQGAALIHGDLWSGNIHCDEKGHPALIDPAVYWGWPEAELAMTILFGGFDSQFYQSYSSNADLAADWQERAPLYNLYHLLNHLLLFGGSYLSQIRSICARFAARTQLDQTVIQ